MSAFEKSLPPLLEQQLDQILRRYRRMRFLRASARFMLFALPALGVFAIAIALGVPLSPPLLPAAFAILILGIGLYCFVPLITRPVTLREIAAHIDARHPELQDRILSAVVLTESDQAVPSAWMLEHFLADTQQQVKGVPLENIVNPREFRLLLAGVSLCGVVLVAGLLAAVWKLGYVRNPTDSAAAGRDAVEFTVEPGNAEVQPGDNQIIWVTSPDTHATRHIYWEQGGEEQRAVLASSSTPEVSYHTFEALQEGLRYRVRVADRTSEHYEIRVSRPPAVESIQLQYTYPEYLRRDPKVVPFGGDIAAVEGTEVTVRVEANQPVASARLVRDTGAALDLEPLDDNRWETRFELDASGSYHIALLDEAGTPNPVPEEYGIKVHPDNPPEIRVRFPRGDTEVLPIEEVPLAFEVEDDFGVAEYGIEYRVAGREPVRLALNEGETVSRQLTGAHLLALEEMELSSGDLVTWAVWASDEKPGRADFEVTGDPFFLEVRPYVRRYREQISNSGAGEAEEGRELLGDQRGVVIAIHNLRKRAAGLGEESYEEDEGRIAEAQELVRSGVAAALGMMDEGEAAIGREAVTAMEAVAEALEAARWPEPEAQLGEALASAQEALQLLMKLEPELRSVMRGGGQGGGGGGSSQPEIDELELAKRGDYQEEARTSADEAAENEETRKGLEELARRQEILNDDLGKLLSEDEKEEDALERKRQLERLREEQERQLERLDELANELAQRQMDAGQREKATRALDAARRNMETSMESARREELQQARAAGSRAARQLEEAEAGLDQVTRESARERLAALEAEMQALRERQEAVQDDVDDLEAAQTAPGVEGEDEYDQRLTALREEKASLAEETEAMLKGAGALSDQLRENQELLARKLGDWTRRTSRTGVVNEMEENRRFLDWGAWDALRDSETQVKRKLDESAEALADLRRYLPGDEQDDLARALDMLNDLEGLGGAHDDAGAADPGTGAGEPGEEEAEETALAGLRDGDGQAGPGRGADAEADGQAGTAAGPAEQEEDNGQRDGSETGDSDGARAPGGEQGSGKQDGGGEQVASSGGGQSGSSAASEDVGPPTPGGAQDGSGGSARNDGLGGLGGPAITRGGGATSLSDFFDQDISDWRPALRDAASLLPRESPIRGTLEGVEMELGQYQREYNNGKELPDVEEFEQVVRRPLMDSIATLEDLVRAREEGGRQWLEDEGAVPSQYEDRVAEYFRILAEEPEDP